MLRTLKTLASLAIAAAALSGGSVWACEDLDRDGYAACGPREELVDCDDTNPAINPVAVELCDGIDNDCNGIIDSEHFDLDHDGFTVCDGDCDDRWDDVRPGAEEECNLRDDDCDRVVDAIDFDGDGYEGCGPDCDDKNTSIYPGAPEICDGLDGDCDGIIDEGFDQDRDGQTPCNGDCNDRDATIFTGAPEICDLVDNDCDAAVDEGFDNDRDTWTPCAGDCVDTDAAIHPAAREVCDSIDNDCDRQIDEGQPDLDADGFSGCNGDCDDLDASINPLAPEICDSIDNNCDGIYDDSCGFIDGVAFIDLNVSGGWDAGEPLVAGAVIEMTGPNCGGSGNLTQTATTAGDGSYSFPNLCTGRFTLNWVNEPSTRLTTTNPVEVNLGLAASDTIDWGTNRPFTTRSLEWWSENACSLLAYLPTTFDSVVYSTSDEAIAYLQLPSRTNPRLALGQQLLTAHFNVLAFGSDAYPYMDLDGDEVLDSGTALLAQAMALYSDSRTSDATLSTWRDLVFGWNEAGTQPPPPDFLVCASPTAVIAATPSTTEIQPLDIIALSGVGSTDPEGGVLRYRWSLASRPVGSAATLNSTSATTSLATDLAGTYVVELTVTDDSGLSDTATWTVNAVPDQALWVEMYWTYARDDMDLHLIHHGPTARGDIRDDLWAYNDCHWRNCNTRFSGVPILDWGATGIGEEDPALDIDDIPGVGPENINIDGPMAGTYLISIHDYPGSRYSSANPVTVNIYIDGVLQESFNYSMVGEDGWWHVAEIEWPAGTITEL